MNVRQIIDSVYYVGVNDRTSDKFENLWPLPYGVTYNSYIVKGSEKTALIDAVEVASIQKLENKIIETIGSNKIDYLVINHMEPDHTGGIPELLSKYPKMTIVGNKITIGMLKGFYGVPDEKMLEIKENDELDLGDVKLKFIMTPMVHWPETMMTLIEDKKLLFSGDAFGCFGALNGGVVDDSMDTGLYFEEMYRYYSNIVAKYGKFVQNALKKLKDLKLDYICTLHGPVWHEKIEDVVGIYDRLSQYHGEKGVTIVYGSMYGNTAEIAEVIAERLSEKGVKNIKIHNVSKTPLSFILADAFRYQGLIIGSPTYSMNLYPPIEAFMSALETREMKDRYVATFGSYTWGSAACNRFKECLLKMNIEEVGALDMKQAPTTNDIEGAKILADKVFEKLYS